jgi:hypothetical protein
VTSVRSTLFESVRCKSTTSITAEEAARLRALAGDVLPTGASLPCEIAAGHDGTHIALAALSEEDQLWWWLWRGGQAGVVRQIDFCDGRDLDDPYLEECLLPLGHPGPHSYQSPGR